MKVHHQLAIEAPPHVIYQALTDPELIGEWWDKQTVRHTGNGVVLEHDPGPEHGVVQMRVVLDIRDQWVEWECISQHPPTSPASAWTGTHLIFEITEAETPVTRVLRAYPGFDTTRLCTLNFFQTDYDERSEFLGFNNFAWAHVLQQLKRFCEE
ncbi:hypothetical protein EZI54_17375 [Marinobacter halodurans]|uniref:SRPBCC domain-containing protein n=1 Tax=Marinobacter halodurans TaxID=2528979 RepID=A0ABY1ZKQ2_9GAMM|nr:hypothetical protein [Marinobacter halodurans]TBW51292.1 hypothetical protein EZI54_17375 [Marinobacter halodurans]